MITRRQAIRGFGGAAGLATASPWASAQEPAPVIPDGFEVPDDRGEVWGGLVYRGLEALAPIPTALRQRNADGSAPGPADGLCVIASLVTDGNWVRLVAEMRRIWAEARRRPGGYGPAKLKGLLKEVVPSLPYLSYEGVDTDWMVPWLQRRIPIAVTMGTGRGYRYRRIAHMVSLIGLWSGYAAIIDNNWPNVVSWMPRLEFNRRFAMGGYGWAFLWRYLPAGGFRFSDDFIPSAIASGLLGGLLGSGIAAYSLRRKLIADGMAGGLA